MQSLHHILRPPQSLLTVISAQDMSPLWLTGYFYKLHFHQPFALMLVPLRMHWIAIHHSHSRIPIRTSLPRLTWVVTLPVYYIHKKKSVIGLHVCTIVTNISNYVTTFVFPQSSRIKSLGWMKQLQNLFIRCVGFSAVHKWEY